MAWLDRIKIREREGTKVTLQRTVDRHGYACYYIVAHEDEEMPEGRELPEGTYRITGPLED